jgi:hypothetical protein
MKGEAGRSYADRAIVVPFQMLKAFFIENSFSQIGLVLWRNCFLSRMHVCRKIMVKKY